jgi:hypothetical protein
LIAEIAVIAEIGRSKTGNLHHGGTETRRKARIGGSDDLLI